MLVSLFSDASVCHHKRVGGWGAWLKSDRGSLRTGGPFRHSIGDISIAEAMAVINGLVAGARAGLIQPGDIVLIQTDNNSVMQLLDGTVRRKISRKKKLQRNLSWRELKRDVRSQNHDIDLVSDAFRRLKEAHSLSVKWRHVKGHKGRKDRRSAVNTFCDEVAGTHMRAARKMHIEPRILPAISSNLSLKRGNIPCASHPS